MAFTNNADWWLYSDAGLLARIGIGVAIFAALAAWDLARKGRAATRWREYLFLLMAAAAGILYGVVNDSIGASVSWEYFYYGKGLDAVLGPRTPPATPALLREAIVVGMKAAGSAGLLAGAVLLLANSAGRRQPRLSFRRLAVYLGGIALASAAGGALLGSAGYFGELSWMPFDLKEIARENLFRPARFQCVWGINIGGYIGGVIGTMIAVWQIQLKRRRMAAALECKDPGVTMTPGSVN